jgi:AAA family ATP:ADP antiporter
MQAIAGGPGLAERLAAVKPREWPALAAGFLLFFLLFVAYMMLRPVRETMGIAGGVDNLQWLFLATFLATLAFIPIFGVLARMIPRRLLLPASYVFAAATLAALGIAFNLRPGEVWTGRIFYVWLSVINLFLVSVAWSVMSDVFRSAQARRLFGPIAAGASLGGIAGPLASGLLVASMGYGGLLILSSALLLGTIPCTLYLFRWHGREGGQAESDNARQAIGGNMVEGLRLILRSPYLLGIALFVVLLASVSTFLYLEQARIVEQALPDPVSRTQLFAAIDAGVQLLTILVQLFATGRVAQKFGLPALLASIPLAMVAGFIALSLLTALPMLILVVALRRVGEYALVRPGREMLFTTVDQPSRYKAKNIIDTVVYRGGDAASAWISTSVQAVGASPLIAGAVFAVAWTVTGLALGRRFEGAAEVARN